MNSLFNRLKYFFTYGSKMKRMMLSIVILAEVIVLLVVATYAWVETVSSIKITNEANTKGTIDTYVFTEAQIGAQQGTIDIAKYFKQAGDMHLAPASSADGTTMFFPKANLSSDFIYRKGNVSDKNTAYLSVSFKIRTDANADFFFDKGTNDQGPSFSALEDDIRVSVTSQSEGSTSAPVTTIYSKNASTTAVVNSTSGGTGATTVAAYSDHIKGTGTTNRLFAVGANETKIITINIWLQKKPGDENTDLTDNMSQAVTINNFGITSSLTRTLTIYRTVDGSTSSTAAAGTITINGSTTANTATSKEVTVDLGSSVTFSAAAEPGYTFDGFYTTATGGSSVTSPISLNSNTTCYARFTKNISNVTIYIAPREGWGNPDLHIWDDNGVIEDHITADYDGASGYYKVTVQTRGDWVKAVLSKNSSYSGQTSDIEVVSNISVGTNYSKFINTSNTVSDWSSTKRCLWFIITQKGIENNLKNDEDYMQVYVNNADKNMRRINDTAYVVELSNPSGAIDFKQKKSDNSTRNEWGTTVPTSSKSQFKQTTSNSGSWQ